MKLLPAVPVTHLPLRPRETRGLSPKRGAWGEGSRRGRPPPQPPSQARRLGRARATPGSSLLPWAAHTAICVTRGKVVCVALGFREVTFAPLQVTSLACCCRGRRLRQLHLALPWRSAAATLSLSCTQTGSGCSALTFAEDWVSACRKPPAAILVKAADAAWLRVHHLGRGSRYPAAEVARPRF